MKAKSDKWDSLAAISQGESRWLSRWQWYSVRVRTTQNRVVLLPGHERIFLNLMFLAFIIFGFALGLGAILVPDLSYRIRVFETIVATLFVVTPMVWLVRLNYAKSLSWDEGGAEIVIGYGLPRCRHQLRISRLDIRPFLCVNEENDGKAHSKIGYSILSLKRISGGRPELVIASGPNHNSLRAAFEKLSEFAAGEGDNDASIRFQISEGCELLIPRTSISQSRRLGDDDRVLMFPSPDTVAFRRTSKLYLIARLSAFFGAFLIVGVIIHIVRETPNIMVIVPGLVLGIGLCVIGFGGLIELLLSQYIVADKRSGILCKKLWLKSSDRGKGVCNLSDIVAVQMCSYDSARETASIRMYEMNLVLSQSDELRLNIFRSRNGPKTRDCAEQFAAFLKVPILYHASEEILD